ncbi:MAG: VCBS repeat-containing protein, partial [Planctomycetaceae bacterium]|nr:VCBS repeat-containing protein [Planctomycetaceae bacterium]
TGQWYAGIASPVDTLKTAYWGRWGTNTNFGWDHVMVLDFNGDGLDDIVGMTNQGYWWLARSTGSGFQNQYLGSWTPIGWTSIQTGDFNGDVREDLIGLHSNGSWWAGFSNGGRLFSIDLASWSSTAGWTDINIGDFNGDQISDVSARTSTGFYYVGLSQPGTTRLRTQYMGVWQKTPSPTSFVGDFNGDGKDELINRNTDGEWWTKQIRNLTGHETRYKFRWSTSVSWIPIVGDFNGDGFDDMLGMIAGTGQWFFSTSFGRDHSNDWRTMFWGQSGAPVPVSFIDRLEQ